MGFSQRIAVKRLLRVPARRDGSTDGSVEIRFVRFPATREVPGSAPIVYLAGGPGGSGVDTSSGDRFPFFMALREAGDVIALGAERLNLVGISYGTHLALAYIRRYPDHVARAVLAGVEGPDHTYKRPSVVDGVVREIGRTLEVEAGWKGFVSDVESAIERLSRERPRVTIEDPSTGKDVVIALGPLDLKSAVHYGLGEREDFLRAARRVRRIARGDDELLARYTLRLRRGGRASVMALSMDCASGVSPERFALIASEEPGALIGDVANMDLTTTCPYWPIEDLGDAFRSPLESTVPVLAVSGTLDVRTPPSNADEVLAGFTNGAHLKIIGGGHGDDLLIATPGIAEAMVRFLQTGNAGSERIVLPSL